MASGALAASAAAVALSAGSGQRRLLALLPAVPTATKPRHRRIADTRGRRMASVSAALGTAIILGGWLGLACAVVVGLAAELALRRIEPAGVRRDRRRVLADLPTALDLLAACLAGGSALTPALSVVAAATGGPLGALLEQVAVTSGLGASASQAWSRLAGPPELVAAGRAIARVADSGAAVADTISRLAEDQRRRVAAAAAVAARRAGVLAVLPLGLCFLPAFVLIGIVPVVSGVASHLLG
ncbi:MAG: hypothetical protein NVSMB13_13290 [Mycobacteriales bacterium]